MALCLFVLRIVLHKICVLEVFCGVKSDIITDLWLPVNCSS